MLLDNQYKNNNIKKEPSSVKEYFEKYIHSGEIDIVTGYFNIGALSFLAEIGNDKIDKFRLIIGDLVKDESKQKQVLSLLNEDLSIESAIKTRENAKKSVNFLKQEKVDVKILEPNFCHAKLYLQKAKDDDRMNFYVSGSSNLTNSGIGLNLSHSNIELNLAGTGENDPFPSLKDWFQTLWDKPQAYREKTIQKGRQKTKINYKQYLIDNISKLFEALTPEQIYYKILFELFHQEENDPSFERDFGRLEDTKIYGALYDFQKSGVRTVIKMLEKHNGAILADAVGLGKTWSALAVMKYYQRKGEVILICPKKLEQNWNQ
jgi:SNF2 family DNA or RNA helicase